MPEIVFDENVVVGRIWYEVNHLTRWDLEWEWMSECPKGEYLRRDDVLAIIEKHVKDNAQTVSPTTAQKDAGTIQPTDTPIDEFPVKEGSDS